MKEFSFVLIYADTPNRREMFGEQGLLNEEFNSLDEAVSAWGWDNDADLGEHLGTLRVGAEYVDNDGDTWKRIA